MLLALKVTFRIDLHAQLFFPYSHIKHFFLLVFFPLILLRKVTFKCHRKYLWNFLRHFYSETSKYDFENMFQGAALEQYES